MLAAVVSDDEQELQAKARVGTTLDDKWTLEKLLGVGGMGAVYAARHRNGARGAVKVLHPEYAAIKEVRDRFIAEGRAANRVEHDGVVKVLDDDVVKEGPNAGAAYLVMELLEGRTLEERLERGPAVGELELMRVTSAVLDTLAAAHERGVVHRDIKPENLFLLDGEPGAAPRVKVLDFGVARLEEGRQRTMHGLALGTPSYMAPEQAAGRADEIDGRSDLFGLGATCFRALTGRTIHHADTQAEMLALIVKQPAPPVRSIAPDVRAEVAEVVDRALQLRREDRWADATEMRAATERAIAALEATSRTLPAPAEVDAPAPSAAPQVPVVVRVASSAASAAPPRRRRGVFVPFAILVLGLIAAKLFYDDLHGAAPEGARDDANIEAADVASVDDVAVAVVAEDAGPEASADAETDAADDAVEDAPLEAASEPAPIEPPTVDSSPSATTSAPHATTAPHPTVAPTTKPTSKPTAKPTSKPTTTTKPKPTSTKPK